MTQPNQWTEQPEHEILSALSAMRIGAAGSLALDELCVLQRTLVDAGSSYAEAAGVVMWLVHLRAERPHGRSAPTITRYRKALRARAAAQAAA